MKLKYLITASLFLSFSIMAEIETTQVKNVEIDNKVVLNGQVEAISESTVSAQVNAKVKKIYVDVDDRVTAGKLLIELDDTEIMAQLSKAEASLKVAQAQANQAETEYKRLQGLSSSSFVSENDMSRASSAVEVAKANISLAQAQIESVSQMLSYTQIIAPYSGVVTARHIEIGETANVGQPLLSGFALNQNRLTVHVPNALIEDVEKQGTLLIKNNQNTWSELSNLTVAPSADPITHTVMVRANISKDEFSQRPGSFIKVGIKTDKRYALVIPASAVINQGDLTGVFVKESEQVMLRQVILGQQTDGQAEVISGLAENEQVVLNGATYLANTK